MSASRHILAAFLGAATLLSAVPASAEIGGVLNGRSANPANLPTRSIDVGLHEADFAREFGARFNLGINETITGFGNASIVTSGPRGSEGFSFGGGAFIYLPNQRILEAVDIAIKPSINYLTTEGNFGYDLNRLDLAAEALVSGKNPIGNTQLNWYANAGLVVQINDGSRNSSTDFDPLVGGGLYMPLGNGQLFFGADVLDGNLDFGVGYRFFLG